VPPDWLGRGPPGVGDRVDGGDGQRGRIAQRWQDRRKSVRQHGFPSPRRPEESLALADHLGQVRSVRLLEVRCGRVGQRRAGPGEVGHLTQGAAAGTVMPGTSYFALKIGA
jgi:hypothetical protein